MKKSKTIKAKIIKKNLSGFSGEAWLVKLGRKYFVVSGVFAMFTGWEVLVFRSDKDGKVNNWMEVCGGMGMSHEEAIEALEFIK